MRLREGADVTLIAAGVMVSRALEAAGELARQGIEARVLNMATIAPLDEAAVVAAAAETGRIVTAEEALVRGGLGSAVAECVVQHQPCRCASSASRASRRPAAPPSCWSISA